MLRTTKTALAAIIGADPSITPEQKNAVLQAAAGRPGEFNAPLPRVIRRSEASNLLGIGLKRVDQLALAGILRRVTIPGCKRAIGFSESSIRAITESAGGAG